jgi:hypothetical protein
VRTALSPRPRRSDKPECRQLSDHQDSCARQSAEARRAQTGGRAHSRGVSRRSETTYRRLPRRGLESAAERDEFPLPTGLTYENVEVTVAGKTWPVAKDRRSDW